MRNPERFAALAQLCHKIEASTWRALAVEIHENWLKAHRYVNIDDLREHKKEALRTAA